MLVVVYCISPEKQHYAASAAESSTAMRKGLTDHWDPPVAQHDNAYILLAIGIFAMEVHPYPFGLFTSVSFKPFLPVTQLAL